jgi:hypothetical protein
MATKASAPLAWAIGATGGVGGLARGKKLR